MNIKFLVKIWEMLRVSEVRSCNFDRESVYRFMTRRVDALHD